MTFSINARRYGGGLAVIGAIVLIIGLASLSDILFGIGFYLLAIGLAIALSGKVAKKWGSSP